MTLRGTLMPRLFLVLTFGVFGCGMLESEAGEPIAGNCENEDSDPDVDVSFRDQIQPKLHMGCGCHNPIPPSTGGSSDSTVSKSPAGRFILSALRRIARIRACVY